MTQRARAKSNDELFQCDDKGRLVAYLYDELDELTATRGRRAPARVRDAAPPKWRPRRRARGAGRWVPPEAELGFSIARKSEPPPRRAAAGAVVEHRAGVGAGRGGGAGDGRRAGDRQCADALRPTGWWSPPGGCAAPQAARGDAGRSRAVDRRVDWRPALAALETTAPRRNPSDPCTTAAPATAAPAADGRRCGACRS